MADETTFYYNYHFPLKVVTFLQGVLDGQNDPNNPMSAADPSDREWFSQPRTFADGGTEVITTTFRLPLSISEITMEILRMPCVSEIWYLDRNNNWRQVLDMQRIPVRVSVTRSDVKSYFKYHVKVYPIVAKQVQFRITRTKDTNLDGTPYPVGLRNCLIRRNVYDRSQGNQYLEDEQDVLGNVIAKYIKDWDAPKAMDDDPNTFWKCAPMPDPSAVANLYLDIRDETGGPKSIDRVYIDPLYAGQHLNIYYSSDDTVGTRKLNPITVAPDADENTDWRVGRGRSDVSSGIGESFYRWSLAIGPQIAQPAWIGVEWTPDFDPTAGPAENPVLLRATDPAGPAFKPSLYYDVGAQEFVLKLDDGTTPVTYHATLAAPFTPSNPLRIVAGWSYAPDKVWISVRDRTGAEIAHFDDEVLDLPHLVTLDGQLEIYRFRGLITALVIKLSEYTEGEAFQGSPTYYVDPDPVIPDSNTGFIPSTTLDHAIYAYSATTQEHGVGGASDTAYEDKEWTPIWRNYVVQKGMLFFPQTISMKYLKLEFSQLTAEPYPVYDSNIQVRYKVFPVSVIQQSTAGIRIYTGDRSYIGEGTFISINGVRSINWMDPNSVDQAVNAIFGVNYNPVQINQSSGFITDTLPNNSGQRNAQTSTRTEFGSSYIYRREVLQPYILAEDQYVTTIKAEGLQAIEPFTDVPWQDIEAQNPGVITHVKATGTIPILGTDWWIYPGQQLKVSAAVMEKLTDTSTVTQFGWTTETRVRFNTTSVHRYEYKTLNRDAAIAYFAGVREVQPYTSTFIEGEDKPYFEFSHYDTDQFVTDHIVQNDVGATSSVRNLYHINNRLFERNLMGWEPDSDAWSWDGTTGRWLRGTAKATLDGLAHTLVSDLQDAAPDEVIDFRVGVKWANLTGLDPNDVAIDWGIRTYNGTTLVSEIVLDQISFVSWAAVAANSNAAPTAHEGWLDRIGTTTIAGGVTGFRIFLRVTNQATGGKVWFDSVNALDHDNAPATVFKSVTTESTFAKVAVDFRDSGLWRGDSMWADINPDSQSIEDTKLAYYTHTIPETIPGGFWSDTIKAWGGDDVEWGTPFPIVSITVDNNRRYQGKRVLHIRRAAGAGEAGIKVKQWTHYVPLGLFRIGAVFYKPVANSNEITVRLRRMSDGVFVYEETVEAPVGRWFEFQTKFVEIPDGPDQEYEVYLTCDGDAEDELYLSDLYTELALVRYFVKLGGIGAPLHEVTDLRFANGRANLTVTNPVNEFSIQGVAMSPEAWMYGARVTPYYLK